MRGRGLVVAAAVGAATLVAACGGSDGGGGSSGGGSDRPVVVWAVGDGAAGNFPAVQLSERIAADRPKHVLYLGDVYETGTPAEFRKMTVAYRPLLRRILPTPGDHEWGKRRVGYDPYWRTIMGRDVPFYYARQVGGWEVLSLNSEVPHDADSAQVRWVRNQLDDSTCRLAFWHRPRFSAGTHHGDERDMAPLWDALAGRAVLVLSGHDHNSQRLKPVDGMTQIIAGAGGRKLYPVDKRDPRVEFSYDEDFAALRMVLHRDRAETSFVRVDGKVLDRHTVRCEP